MPSRRAAAGLRRRRERARLALCRGPRAGARADRSSAAASARPTMSAAATSAATSTWSQRICAVLDRVAPDANRPPRELITFVADRPGHDLRYAIDATKLETRTRLAPARRPSRRGIEKTVRWYLDNEGGGGRCASAMRVSALGSSKARKARLACALWSPAGKAGRAVPDRMRSQPGGRSCPARAPRARSRGAGRH